jgi:hypothetical protein
MGDPERDEQTTDLMGGEEVDERATDLLDGEQADEQVTDVMGGRERDEQKTDLIGGCGSRRTVDRRHGRCGRVELGIPPGTSAPRETNYLTRTWTRASFGTGLFWNARTRRYSDWTAGILTPLQPDAAEFHGRAEAVRLSDIRRLSAALLEATRK